MNVFNRHPSEGWGPFGVEDALGLGLDASLRWHDGEAK